MAAPIRPLKADRDSTFTLGVRFLAGGLPVDLSEATATFQVLSRAEVTTVLYSYDAATTEDGWITVGVTDEQTTLWPDGKFSYRLVLERDGAKEFLLTGPFTVRTPANV